MSDTQRLPFEPVFPEGSAAPALLLDFARELASLPEQETARERNTAIEACRRRALKGKGQCDAAGRQLLLSAIHVLADLAKQGWSVQAAGESVAIRRNGNGVTTTDDSRERVRGQLHAERDEQLRQPATAAFVRSLEARKLFNGQFVSIFSLMRDGCDLAAR